MEESAVLVNPSGLAIIAMILVGIIAWYFGSRIYPNRKSQVLMAIGITAPIVWLVANLSIGAIMLEIIKHPELRSK